MTSNKIVTYIVICPNALFLFGTKEKLDNRIKRRPEKSFSEQYRFPQEKCVVIHTHAHPHSHMQTLANTHTLIHAHTDTPTCTQAHPKKLLSVLGVF